MTSWYGPLIDLSKASHHVGNFVQLLGFVHRSTPVQAIFGASVGEIFLPITWRPIDESENENMFISKRLYTSGGNNLAEDLICTSYRLCGSPLDPEHGFIVGKNSRPLYCEKSSDRLHAVSLIYRPFMVLVSSCTYFGAHNAFILIEIMEVPHSFC
ncbi:hypothetical protein CRYUN_Cryun35bG0065300 [Craigia yunnanensis]